VGIQQNYGNKTPGAQKYAGYIFVGSYDFIVDFHFPVPFDVPRRLWRLGFRRVSIPQVTTTEAGR